jgi:flavin-binding protein dodecin
VSPDDDVTGVVDAAGDEAGFAALGRHAAVMLTAISVLKRTKLKGRCIVAEYYNNQIDEAGGEGEDDMSVAKVSEISATSKKSFEDAIAQGIARANKTLRNVRGAWIKEQQVLVSKGSITEYQVNMMVTFVIDD